MVDAGTSRTRVRLWDTCRVVDERDETLASETRSEAFLTMEAGEMA